VYTTLVARSIPDSLAELFLLANRRTTLLSAMKGCISGAFADGLESA
jgi:hypothetical protein